MDEQKYSWVIPTVIMMVCSTLSLVVIAMVTTLLFGLFHPGIDNKEIFAIFSPAFSTIIGGMLGIMSGIRMGSKKKEDEEIDILPSKPKKVSEPDIYPEDE